MKQAPLYRVITIPRFQWGLPIDYFLFTLTFSLMFGGLVVGKWIIGGSLALVTCSLITATILWVIGFLKGRKDPEFFGVWFLHKFKVGQSSDSRRSYEP